MKTYKITVHGCDADTEIEFAMSDEIALQVKKIAKLITKNSRFQCQPTMEMEELKLSTAGNQ